MKFCLVSLLLASFGHEIVAFRLLSSSSSRVQSTSLHNHHVNNQESTRLIEPSKVSKVIASALGLFFSVASPAFAFGELEAANNKLANYGLPPILFVPPNFTPIVSEFGRGNSREQMSNPVVVEFSHPSLWVTATTNVNNNGESGTISANGKIYCFLLVIHTCFAVVSFRMRSFN